MSYRGMTNAQITGDAFTSDIEYCVEVTQLFEDGYTESWVDIERVSGLAGRFGLEDAIQIAKACEDGPYSVDTAGDAVAITVSRVES